MYAVLNLIDNIISLYIYVLLFAVIASWLISFNVINTSNRVVYTIVDFLYKVTEPALRPIRRLLPNLGGLDLSPVVLILLLWFLRDLLFEIAGPRRGF
jgi:YggT family protein